MKVQLCQFKRYLMTEGPGLQTGSWESGIAYVTGYNERNVKVLDSEGKVVQEKELWQTKLICSPTCFIDDGLPNQIRI